MNYYINMIKCRWQLTLWGRVTHICVGNLTNIGSDNGLSPGRRQAIIWTSAGILLIGPLETNFSELLIEIQTFLFKKKHLKVPSVKLRPFCLGLNELVNGCNPHLIINIDAYGWARGSCYAVIKLQTMSLQPHPWGFKAGSHAILPGWWTHLHVGSVTCKSWYSETCL